MEKLETKIEADLQGLLSKYIDNAEETVYDHSFDYDYSLILEQLTSLIKRYTK